MNWQYLKYFAAVAQEEHCTKAAEKLFISQPALSKAMNNLEQDIGVPLFIKQGRNIKLTPSGAILKEQVIKATQLIEDAVSKISLINNAHSRLVRLSSIFTLGNNFLPPMINAFQKTDYNNGIRFHYNQKATLEIIEDLLNEKIDVGFCGDFIYNDHRMDIERKMVTTEELFIVVPEGHKFAGMKSLNFRDIINETFIGWNNSTGIALSIMKTLKSEGLADKVHCAYFATEDNTVAEMTRQGLGIAMMSAVPSIDMRGLCKINIDDIKFSRDLYMIWKKGLVSPHARRFIDFVSRKVESGNTPNNEPGIF